MNMGSVTNQPVPMNAGEPFPIDRASDGLLRDPRAIFYTYPTPRQWWAIPLREKIRRELVALCPLVPFVFMAWRWDRDVMSGLWRYYRHR
jgi:hypothetical protein